MSAAVARGRQSWLLAPPKVRDVALLRQEWDSEQCSMGGFAFGRSLIHLRASGCLDDCSQLLCIGRGSESLFRNMARIGQGTKCYHICLSRLGMDNSHNSRVLQNALLLSLHETTAVQRRILACLDHVIEAAAYNAAYTCCMHHMLAA